MNSFLSDVRQEMPTTATDVETELNQFAGDEFAQQPSDRQGFSHVDARYSMRPEMPPSTEQHDLPVFGENNDDATKSIAAAVQEEQKTLNIASYRTAPAQSLIKDSAHQSLILDNESSSHHHPDFLLSVPSVVSVNSTYEELGSVLLRTTHGSVTSFGRANAAGGWRRFLGILYAVAAGFIFTFASVSSKKLLETGYYTSGEVGFLRFIFVPLCAMPFLVFHRTNPLSRSLLKEHGVLLCLRGLIGSCGFLLRVVTLARIPLGDATTIFFTTPVFVGIMARLFLGERYHKTYAVSSVLAFCGCLLISRPSFLFPIPAVENDIDDAKAAAKSLTRLEGCAAALCSAIVAGGVYVVLRKLRKVDIAVTIFYFGLGGTLTSGTWSLLATHSLPWPHGWMDWMWIFFMSAAANIGQSLFTRAFKYENANVVALFGAGDIVWAFLAQFVFFGVAPQLLSLAGAALIVISVVFVALKKLIESLPENSTTRQRLMQSCPVRCCVWCMPAVLRPKYQRNSRRQSTTTSKTNLQANDKLMPNITVFVAAATEGSDDSERVRVDVESGEKDVDERDAAGKAMMDDHDDAADDDPFLAAEAVALAAGGDESGAVPKATEEADDVDDGVASC